MIPDAFQPCHTQNMSQYVNIEMFFVQSLIMKSVNESNEEDEYVMRANE